MVLSSKGFQRRYDGVDEPKMKPYTFTCEIWSTDLGDGVHEDPAVLRSSFCDGLFSTGEDSLVTWGLASFCYTHGGVLPQ